MMVIEIPEYFTEIMLKLDPPGDVKTKMWPVVDSVNLEVMLELCVLVLIGNRNDVVGRHDTAGKLTWPEN